ncbi:MAG: B12-binding domain-containing protein, partial [Microcoleus sp. CAN_BIN18]|nr:B12-binding domain-containing protein [Microcoleus sp. CAN_BIN18]
IRRIRQELPGCHVILGVSNISFGLNPAARQVLNSMFLHEAMQAGMDSAIISANKILPLAKIDPKHQEICRKLIYDEREFDGDICVYDPLGDLTTVFAGKTTKRDRTEDANLPVEQRLKQHIIDGERIGLDIQLTKALETYAPLHIINTFLLDGMKVVGELFGSGQMQLPFVLQSAETMKAAVAYLEPHMEQSESGDNSKGTFIIATVKGDVHDIGKNLVDIILSNNGYRVINLGIKQPVDNIIDAYEKHKADCIAMSGLLVKSTAFMKENLEVFNQKGITVPVILGGAALTPKFVHEDCQNTYKGKVIYGKDAFSDLNFMEKLMPAKSAGNWEDLQGFLDEVGQDNGVVKEVKTAEEIAVEDAKKAAKLEIPTVIDTRRSEAVDIDIDRPNPPFWGTQLLRPEDIPFEELLWHLDLQALVAGQWQFRKPKDQSREEYDAFLAEKVYPILEEWKHKIITEKLLHPQAIYGYFPCQSEGNSLHIYHSEIMSNGQDVSTPAATWIFPRQKSARRMCIADFFAPKESGKIDVFPMQVATVGEVATEYAQKLFANNQYTDYLYFHGLAVQTAEAVAEWTHARIRRELGFGSEEPDNIRNMLAQRYRGSRYSFGYPACPNMADQYKQLELLKCDRINLYMDESEQLYPEQSTTAIITYHPAAKYFTA